MKSDKMKYDKKLMDRMADDLENYLEIVDKYIIIEGLSPEDYKKARKKVKKLIKHLRKGEGDKVFDKERYEAYIENNSQFDTWWDNDC